MEPDRHCLPGGSGQLYAARNQTRNIKADTIDLSRSKIPIKSPDYSPNRYNMTRRREFLTMSAAAAFLDARELALAAPSQAAAWDQLPKLLARIKPPVFAKRDFDITKYGAAPGAEKDCSDAIKQAIDACN